MIERINLKRHNEEGFTLVELLVVIVILGILAAIVVFAVGGISDKGQTSACKSDKASIESAEEANYAQTSTYVDMGALVGAKLLRADSTLYKVTVTGTGATATYTVDSLDTAVCPT